MEKGAGDMITPGQWTVGRAGSVVTDKRFRDSDRDSDASIEFYGGVLVCESCKTDDAKIIAAAKEMYFLINALVSAESDISIKEDAQKIINNVGVKL